MAHQQSTTEILSLLPITDERWMAYIYKNSQANIFHHPAWSQLLAECYGFNPKLCVVCDTNGNILAGLPIMKIQSWLTGKRWVSLPFTDHCAPLYQDSEFMDRLVKGLFSLCSDPEFPRIELRWDLPIKPQLNTDPRYMLNTVNLGSGPETVAARIKRKQFRQIKVAEERGVHTEIGISKRQLKEFYYLHLQNRRKHGVPVQPWMYFILLSNHLLDKGYGFIISAYKNQTCIAAAVFLHWNHTLIYKYSASNEEGRHLFGMDLILWEAICWGCEHGMQVLDMGRSLKTEKGLRDYKNRWGGEESPLSYSYLPPGHPQGENDRLVDLIKPVIQHSPLWVCRYIGEILYKYAG
jgi:CelD/BcsL family acetyltransferase involved in cellulose biosynthesis